MYRGRVGMGSLKSMVTGAKRITMLLFGLWGMAVGLWEVGESV